MGTAGKSLPKNRWLSGATVDDILNQDGFILNYTLYGKGWSTIRRVSYTVLANRKKSGRLRVVRLASGLEVLKLTQCIPIPTTYID